MFREMTLDSLTDAQRAALSTGTTYDCVVQSSFQIVEWTHFVVSFRSTTPDEHWTQCERYADDNVARSAADELCAALKTDARVERVVTVRVHDLDGSAITRLSVTTENAGYFATEQTRAKLSA